MKILLLSNEYPPETAYGGISTYVGYLAKELVKAGHKVAVVSLSLDVDKEAISEGVRVIRLARPKWPLISAFGWEWRAAKRLERLSREEGYEIIEAPAWTGQAFFYRRSWGVPLVVRLMTPYAKATTFGDKPSWWRRAKTIWMEGRALRQASLYLALSESISQEYQQLYHIDKDKIRLAPAGIPAPLVRDGKADPNMILFLGRLEPRKGVDLLLESMPLVWEQIPKVKLILVGKDQPLAPGGETYQKWAEHILTPEQLEKIKFTGFVSDEERSQYLANCQLLVAPSRYESFGLIYLEAMSYGKPVIGARNGGAEDIIEDGENGYLSELSAAEIAGHLIKILKDKDLAKSMGKRSLEIFNNKFTDEKMVQSTIKFYREALGND